MSFFSPDFQQFFIDLAPNNNKDWFDENRKRYEHNVKEPFRKFVEHMIAKLSEEEQALKDVQVKDCIFRINRDIRFSKIKEPYKMNVSAAIAPNGRKDHRYPGIYFELGPEKVVIAGGAYQMDKEQLLELRQHIFRNSEKWTAAATEKNFNKNFGGLKGAENKRIAAPFMEASKEQGLLLKKQLYYWTELDPSWVLNKKLDEEIIRLHRASTPVRNLLKEVFI